MPRNYVTIRHLLEIQATLCLIQAYLDKNVHVDRNSAARSEGAWRQGTWPR